MFNISSILIERNKSEKNEKNINQIFDVMYFGGNVVKRIKAIRQGF